MTAPRLVPRLQVLATALLFSTGGVAIKSCQLASWQIASFRCAVAAIAMWALLPRARRRWTGRVLAVAVAYAATMVLYALANKLTTAANAIFLQSTAPFYVLLLAPLMLGERGERRDVFAMVAMGFGMALFFVGREPASATAPDPALGNLLGAAAGLCWALTMIGLRWLGREGGDAPVAVTAGNWIGFIVCLPMALPVTAGRLVDWGLVVYLGVFQIAVAYVLLTRAVESVPAFELALLLLVEPVLNPVWAWWVHGEVPGSWSLAGGAVVLMVTAVKTWLDATRR